MSSTLDKEAIRRRLNMLADDEQAARSALHMAGQTSWPLGDRIRATLDDVHVLLARAEALETELESRSAEPDPLRAALIGILRADGYGVTEPRGLINHDDCGPEDPEAASVPNPDTRALAGVLPTACPKCVTALPVPGGPCRYVDCNKPEEPADELFEGAIIRFGYGLHEGRQALITGKGGADGQNWTARLLSRHVDVTDPIEIDSDRVGRPILVDPVDPDAAPPVEPAKDERKRAEEPPRLASEWVPSAAQIKTFAKDLGVTEERVTALVAEFKDVTSKNDPTMKLARWGGAFKPWAAAKIGAPT